jgi:hypothetical protein
MLNKGKRETVVLWLFYDTVSSTKIEREERLPKITKREIGKRQRHISRYYYPGILLERLRKTTKFIGDMSRDFEPGTSRLQALSVTGTLIASVQVLAFTVLLDDWIQLAQYRYQW